MKIIKIVLIASVIIFSIILVYLYLFETDGLFTRNSIEIDRLEVLKSEKLVGKYRTELEIKKSVNDIISIAEGYISGDFSNPITKVTMFDKINIRLKEVFGKNQEQKISNGSQRSKTTKLQSMKSLEGHDQNSAMYPLYNYIKLITMIRVYIIEGDWDWY